MAGGSPATFFAAHIVEPVLGHKATGNQHPKTESCFVTLDEEKALLDRSRRDPTAFGVLFDHYYQPLFGYVHRRVLDWDVSRDIVSETFLKAYTHLGRFRWLGISLAAWLYRIATNEVNLYFRRGKYAPTSLTHLHDEFGFDLRDSSPAERVEAERQLAEYQDFLAIQAALKTLDVKYQEVIALRFFEEKSILQIAEILGKPEGTVKSLLSRGLEKIRRKVERTATEPDEPY